MKSARDLTYGMALGGGLMFLFDPRRGAARRATVRQKSARAAHEVETAFGIGARDLGHRVQGVATLLFGKRRPARVPDDVLVARVRSRLGRLCSHPQAVDVTVKGDGAVELSGPILREEVESVIFGVSRVRGVCSIDDDLEVHSAPDVSALQGGGRRSRTRPLFTPATRLVLGLAAAALSIVSLIKGRPLGLLASGAAVVGLSRSVTHRSGLRRPLLSRKEQRKQAEPRGLREAYPRGSERTPPPPTAH